MLRFTGTTDALEGLLAADDWQAEKLGGAIASIGYEDSFFALEELLGWYGDLTGVNPDLEKALTRLASLVVAEDLQLIAHATRDAIHLRRSIETRLLSA